MPDTPTPQTSESDEARAVADLIAEGRHDAAFTAVRARLGWPRGKDLTVGSVQQWIALLGELAQLRGATQLAELATATVRDPDSPDRLYDLGYALIDAGAPAIAASVLWRCLALVGDSEEVVCELVSALESALAYPDAFDLLAPRPDLRARSFLCQYLYAFNAAMTGRLEVTRDVLALLAPDSPETATMHGTIAAIVERADRIAGAAPLDDNDLRGWHYVLTGGLVTHQSPYGYEAPMHGRYAWLQDTPGRIATGIARLAALVEPAAVSCVYAPPDRGSEILGHAAALVLGLPLAPWPAVGVPAPGLIVVYDLAELPATELARLHQRRPDQILFAHASPWTHDSPVAPDVTTLLYQSLVPPWGQTMLIDPSTRKPMTTDADDRPAAEVAAELVNGAGLDPSELAADEPARWTALVARAWPLAPGPRSRLWAGGPVPSNRFD